MMVGGDVIDGNNDEGEYHFNDNKINCYRGSQDDNLSMSAVKLWSVWGNFQIVITSAI